MSAPSSTESNCLRFTGSERISKADKIIRQSAQRVKVPFWMHLKKESSFSSPVDPAFLSGWCLSAFLRCPFLICSSVALYRYFDSPRTA